MTEADLLTGVPSSEPTQRELEVLDAVTRPRATYASAALELGIKPSTVKQTLRTLYLRLDVCSQAQAVRAVGHRLRPPAVRGHPRCP